jgi:hypothetical protein
MSMRLQSMFFDTRIAKLELAACLEHGGLELSSDYLDDYIRYACESCLTRDRRTLELASFVASCIVVHFHRFEGRGCSSTCEAFLVISLVALRDIGELRSPSAHFLQSVVLHSASNKLPVEDELLVAYSALRYSLGEDDDISQNERYRSGNASMSSHGSYLQSLRSLMCQVVSDFNLHVSGDVKAILDSWKGHE